MAQQLNVERIWWRKLQEGEFYNIERYPRLDSGGGGSLYIEIPKSIVPQTLDFLDAAGSDVDALPVITIEAGVIGESGLSGPIEFHRKGGGRMRIARQNRQQPNSQRHPAWTSRRGFPSAPDRVRNKKEAVPYMPDGGVRIYIAKTAEGEYYAGFTTGPRPAGMAQSHPLWKIFEGNVGGVIDEN